MGPYWQCLSCLLFFCYSFRPSLSRPGVFFARHIEQMSRPLLSCETPSQTQTLFLGLVKPSTSGWHVFFIFSSPTLRGLYSIRLKRTDLNDSSSPSITHHITCHDPRVLFESRMEEAPYFLYERQHPALPLTNKHASVSAGIRVARVQRKWHRQWIGNFKHGRHPRGWRQYTVAGRGTWFSDAIAHCEIGAGRDRCTSCSGCLAAARL